MAIDLEALRGATQGDQEAKVAVKRKWLTEVYNQLDELVSLRNEVTRLRAEVSRHPNSYKQHIENEFKGMNSTLDQFNGWFGGNRFRK